MGGLFIALEGGDGVGKKTQFDLLISRLLSAGHQVFQLEFPRYDLPDGAVIRHILKSGTFTSQETQSDWLSGFAAAYFGRDRAVVADTLRRHLVLYGSIVIANRFTWTNIAHQIVKVKSIDPEKARRLIEYVEFDHFKLPRPDLNVLLNVSVNVSRMLMASRAEPDAHESDIEYQLQVRAYFLRLAEEDPEHWSVIDCENGRGGLLPIEEIHEKIWAVVESRLSKR